ncbi:multiple sugar transport system permease protein [Paenarthrobacter nicotinovorans]|uniref:carbohydrate ABC transporter permease n=1 Tax=Paenarthrobacter nicotinovorans TaxID=29320 RepID=UPI00277D30BD|nr:carbohydrate ABC transporter permease [Paenarthrobacter nicotinovorans]MDP9933748.1 multiple sugar transport system permease protein [Paenarthrobacter nicotinovorans]
MAIIESTSLATRPNRKRHFSSPGALRATGKKQFYRHLLLIAMASVMFYPLAWMLGASFRDDSQIANAGLWPGDAFTLAGYQLGWEGVGGTPFWRFMINSLLISGLSVAANLIACSITAYAFARINFKFKKAWFGVMLGTLMLPHHVILIPQYIMFREFDWINTYLPFIVPKILATDAFFIFLLVQFFRAIPRELDEAARIDGLGHVGIFYRVILPLSKPALATTAIFTFIYSWNDFFTPLIYLTDTDLYTVPLALRSFIDATSYSAFGALFGMSIISLLPVLGIFIAFQRLLVEGIATSGMKG